MSCLAAVGFLLITWEIITLIVQQPNGYVIDIYSVLPGFFFPALILSFLIASVVLLGGNSTNRNLAILLLIVTDLTLLIVPYMLGYYSMGRSDDMTYIGEYVQIANSGHVAGWDIYPASLIYGGMFSLVSGLYEHQAAYIIPILFSFIFTSGLILFCRLITTDRFYVDIAIISSFILYLGPFNFANTPNALFFAFVPIFIYVIFRYVKAQTIPNAILMLTVTVLMPFSHPFIFYFVFGIQLVLILVNPVMKKLSDFNFKMLFRPVIMTACIFLTWFLSSEALTVEFRRSYLAYLDRASSTVLNETVGKLSIADFDILDIFKLLMVYYGRYLIPILIIVLALLYVFLKRNTIPKETKRNLKFLTILFLIYAVFEGIIVVNPLITHTPDRISNLNFIVYAQVPLFAYAILILFPRSKNGLRTVVGLAIIVLIISTTWGLSLYGSFNSPNTFEPNSSLMYNEVDSMRWFYESRGDLSITAPSTQIFRYHDLFNDGSNENFMITMPDHFGYNATTSQFSNATWHEGQPIYVDVPTLDELLYQEVPGYTHVARYTADDFTRFRTDPSVDKVFDGLNNEIYHSVRY